jgi:ubiquinone/menaquinone biosynthesis C-methylase UbiE
MDRHEYQLMAENEDSHFFYLGNHALILGLIDKFTASQKRLKILDAGCGTGGLSRKLQQSGHLVSAVDNNSLAVNLAKKKGVKAQKSSLDKLPFASNLFDVVVCIDVLYHKQIGNDLKALRELTRVLKKNGLIIIRVPALAQLASNHDKLVHTRERYQKEKLIKLINKTPLRIEKISFVNFCLFLPLLIKVLYEKMLRIQVKSAVNKPSPVLNRILTKLLLLESAFLINYSWPLGIGLVVVARKR